MKHYPKSRHEPARHGNLGWPHYDHDSSDSLTNGTKHCQQSLPVSAAKQCFAYRTFRLTRHASVHWHMPDATNPLEFGRRATNSRQILRNCPILARRTARKAFAFAAARESLRAGPAAPQFAWPSHAGLARRRQSNRLIEGQRPRGWHCRIGGIPFFPAGKGGTGRRESMLLGAEPYLYSLLLSGQASARRRSGRWSRCWGDRWRSRSGCAKRSGQVGRAGADRVWRE